MFKLIDKGKYVLALQSAPRHAGVWDSGCILPIMLSRDSQGEGVVKSTTQQNYSQRKWSWYYSTADSTEPRVCLEVLEKRKFFDVTQSNSGRLEEERILQRNPKTSGCLGERKVPCTAGIRTPITKSSI